MEEIKVNKRGFFWLFNKYWFTIKGLNEKTVNPDPFLQFDQWFKDAIKTGIPFHEAMTLSTISPEGRPSSRVVLLKEFDGNGFVFYTNYDSRKSKEIDQSGFAALSFFWADLNRQLRIEGMVERVLEDQADRYHQSRPRGSQLGAWASPQSQEIPDREYLEKKANEIKLKFNNNKVPRPPNWGGYRVIPDRIEFWQARADRLHDRIVYSKIKEGGWKIFRIAP
ncbi:MAG TPA: pyridoxamine 5'-phosphate oxidase [Flavobacteriales bacterium]|nr:pyridoxamine 5'-phosphate oxidase [Flavobacteriales bacterium]HIN40596.1 pyridoxamine 5'-phosphate oxidase [Flavobacteriales bacterium]